VPRPPNTRKMTDRTVRQAATWYQTGESLKTVAARFGVDPRTLAREFKKAGIQVRPRRGWSPGSP
jgi:AraC-like DNA-binding protein